MGSLDRVVAKHQLLAEFNGMIAGWILPEDHWVEDNKQFLGYTCSITSISSISNPLNRKFGINS